MENAGRGVADIVRRELGAGGAPQARARSRSFAARAPTAATGSWPRGTWRGRASRYAWRSTAPRGEGPRRRGDDAGGAASGWAACRSRTAAAGRTEARWRDGSPGAGVVVDAIFGTGFRGAIAGVPAAALAAMNAARARKLAVDVPSGLDADSGRARRRRVPRRRDGDDGRAQAGAVRGRGRAGRAGRGRRARRSDP